MGGAAVVALQLVAALSSVCVCLSPAPGIYRVYKSRSVGDMSVLPLVSLGLSCHAWMLYGLLIGNLFPFFTTYVVGDIAAGIFIAFYYAAASSKRRVARATGVAGAFAALLTLYVVLAELGCTNQSTHETSKIVGFISTGVSVVLYASPFAVVVRTRSAASMPILMCVLGVICNSLWAAYGIIEGDIFITAVNVICVSLGAAQVAYYFVCRARTRSVKSEAKSTVTPTSSTDLLTPTEDINVAMSGRDEFVIVISPASSIL